MDCGRTPAIGQAWAFFAAEYPIRQRLTTQHNSAISELMPHRWNPTASNKARASIPSTRVRQPLFTTRYRVEKLHRASPDLMPTPTRKSPNE
jgi:hypothetical protein